MKISNTERAEVLTEALPYIQEYTNKIIVVKYGGNAMINEDLKRQVMGDVALLSLVGVKVVLVHGGGPEITDLLSKTGKKSEFVNGLRVTDKETLDCVIMALAGKVNKSLVTLLHTMGGSAVGLSGVDGHLIEAEQKNPALGYVGQITKINIKPITDLLDCGYIPVISSIASGADGTVYNVNADTAAAYIAGALGAECMVSMTDISGVLRDKDDPSSIIPVIDLNDAVKLFTDGIISGGMIPKVECCISAINLGVSKVFILDGRTPHSILIEILTDEGSGTMVVKNKDSLQPIRIKA